MRPRPLLLLPVLLVLGLALLWLHRKQPPPRGLPAAPPTQRLSEAPPAIKRKWSIETEQLKEARAKRDALRATILRAMEAAPAQAVGAPSPLSKAPSTKILRRPSGDLTNRSGAREVLVAEINKDFMPLADECIEHAQEQSPQLAGLLVIDIETVADKDLGAVVEQAEWGARNEIKTPELIECIRETALSMRLPPPPASGREKFELSLRVESKPEAGHDM